MSPGAFLSVVGLVSGACACWQLSAAQPIWLAIVVVLAAVVVLVGCLTAASGSDFLDVLIASATIVFLIGFLLPALIIHKQHKKQRPPPTQTQKWKRSQANQAASGNGAAAIWFHVGKGVSP